MRFKHAKFDETKEVKMTGISGKISGRDNAVFLRNRYQKELDNANAAIVNMVHYLEERLKELKYAKERALSFKANIEAHEEERRSAYESLQNLLNKELQHEYKLWISKTTQLGMKKSNTIKQKLKDVDLEDSNFGQISEFFKQYPEYATKSSFKLILDKINSKEAEIRSEKERYNSLVSKYNYLISTFEVDIQKTQDKFEAYNNILQEGERKIKNSRYVKSIAFKLASEKSKQEVLLDTLNHRISQFQNTFEIIKKNLSTYKNEPLQKLEH